MTKNVQSKTWSLPVSWDGRRYSEAADVPGQNGGGAALAWSTASLADGQSMTITTDGTYNFGTKPNGAKPRFFFDWRLGSLASAALSRDSYNTWNATVFEMQSGTTYNGGAGAAALKFTGTNQSAPTSSPYPDLSQSGDKFFIYKVWASNFTAAQAYANSTAWNFKWTRLYSDSGGNQSTPYISVNAGQHPTHANLRAGFPPTAGVTYYGASASVLSNTNWRFEETAVKQSSADDVTDAEYHTWFEGQKWSVTGYPSHTAAFPKATYPWRYASLSREQNVWADASWRIFFDCWYIDDSWCRVVVSTEATWSDAQSGSRYRYVQIPTAWSANSITVTLRDGGMGGFAGKYLYVITNDGAPVTTTGLAL